MHVAAKELAERQRIIVFLPGITGIHGTRDTSIVPANQTVPLPKQHPVVRVNACTNV
jgi:hypothetical protein